MNDDRQHPGQVILINELHRGVMVPNAQQPGPEECLGDVVVGRWAENHARAQDGHRNIGVLLLELLQYLLRQVLVVPVSEIRQGTQGGRIGNWDGIVWVSAINRVGAEVDNVVYPSPDAGLQHRPQGVQVGLPDGVDLAAVAPRLRYERQVHQRGYPVSK